MAPKDYTQLKELLEKETYPGPHIFKFVGKNSSGFESGVRRLEEAFPGLQLQSSRLSAANAQGVQAHRAMTYVLQASSAEEIISVLHVIDTIEDLIFVL